MNDKELLEAAAKAAEYRIVAWIKDDDGVEVALCQMLSGGGTFSWQPLHENTLTDCMGDALRLAVKLQMVVDCVESIVVVSYRIKKGEFTFFGDVTEEYGSDPYAATRRAITRAAAGENK